MKTHDREKEGRDSIFIMLSILLLGFICIIFSSGWALRFAPSWKLPSAMGSNLNPDSDFLTGRPVDLFEPLDPSILTNPPWIEVFLTPGASFSTRTPLPAADTNTPFVTNTNTGIPVVVTVPPTNTPVPTNTLIYFPPPSSTSTTRPRPSPTPELPTATLIPTATFTPSSTSSPSADLQITKTDGVTTYVPGGSVTYTIVVSNPGGPNPANGALVTDTFPSQIASTTWVCTPSGGASCTASGTGNINQTVNLPVASSVTYTVNATIAAAASGNLTNTASVSVPAGYTDPNAGNNSATDTDTPSVADLQITKTDNASDYEAGGTTTYTIIASNPSGPSGVTGAIVSDDFLSNPNLTGVTWTCTGSGGASCTASGSGNINDTVNLPVGGSVQYTANAVLASSPSGPLVNTAVVNIPGPVGVTDPNTSNNSATDADQLIVANPIPGSIGHLNPGSYSDYRFGTDLVVSPGSGSYLVYYPDYPNSPPAPLEMDVVILQIGDGRNWYTVFIWGNGAPDTNTDINPADCPSETDNCLITLPPTNPPGVTINLNGVVPDGTYRYIRILSPSAPADSGDGLDVNTVTKFP